MLYIGEELGRGGYEVDIAVDPVEGTNLVANGLPNSIAVMAIAGRGGLLHAPDSYMQKLAVGPKAAPFVHIDAPVAREPGGRRQRARARRSTTSRVVILDRPRHADLIAAVRAGRRADQAHLRRRRRRGDRDRASMGPASTSRWGSAARPKACWRRRRSSAWAAASWAGSSRAARKRPSARKRWASATSTASSRSTTSRKARHRLRARPGSPTATSCTACASSRQRTDPLDPRSIGRDVRFIESIHLLAKRVKREVVRPRRRRRGLGRIRGGAHRARPRRERRARRSRTARRPVHPARLHAE